jgi:hypothetical protein
MLMLPLLLSGQYAVFTTDTLHLDQGNEKGSEWFIAGQHLQLDGGSIKVKTDELLDTILYRTDKDRDWDTIICQISLPNSYRFVYNECCGGFYIADSIGHFIQARTIFKTSASKQWHIGKLGDDGILLPPGNKETDTLDITCHSVLMPNIFNVSFAEIKGQADSTNFIDNTCIKMGNDFNYNYTYTSTKTYCNFLYMPLSNAPVTMTIDRKRGMVMIRNGE